MKKERNYFIFIILSSLMVITSIYIIKEISPFGSHSLLTIDFYHQYSAMLGELYRRISHLSNLTYSFNAGIGAPFFRNFFNYLASPCNIIMFLFKYKGLLTSFSLIIGLKAIFSAFAIGYYLKEKHGCYYRFVPLTIFYAFSAYFVAYYWNIMWLDGMYMLPFITLGIEKMIDKDKPILYVVSLSIMLFINYFIGYMLCIYSVLYFILYMFLKTNKLDYKYIFNKTKIFTVNSLMVGLFCLAFLGPLFTSVKGISATGDEWPHDNYYAFKISDYVISHYSGTDVSVLKSDGDSLPPNISLGIVSFGLLFIFFLNKKIKVKTKIGYGVFLILLLLSFVIPQLSFIWHGFHVPNDLPYRYSFIYSFVLAVISSYALKNIKEINKYYVLGIYIVLFFGIILLKIFNYEKIDDLMLGLNILVLTIYYIAYLLYIRKIKYANILMVILIVVAIIHNVLIINKEWEINDLVASYYDDYDDNELIIDYLNKQEKDKFFRMEFINDKTLNDGSLYGYYGIDSFSSMENENTAILMTNLGSAGNEINSYNYKNNTPIYSLMFDLKYLVGDINDSYYIKDNEELNIYKSEYSLGLMYGVNKNILDWLVIDYAPFYNQNEFIEKASGVSDALYQADALNSEIVYQDDIKTITKYDMTNTEDRVYFYINDMTDIDFVIVNDIVYTITDDYAYLFNYTDDYQNIRSYDEKQIINMINNYDIVSFYIGSYGEGGNVDIYKLNSAKLKEAYTYLDNYKVDITKFTEKQIIGKTNFDKDMVIYTSIPYDSGWKVYVDGKKVDTISLVNTLLAFDVNKGKHTIELRYNILYGWIYLLISLASIIGYVIYYRCKRVKV